MPETTSQPTSAKTQERLHDLVTCPKCGEDSAEGTRYCDNCGTSLAGALASQPAQTGEAKRGLFGRLFRRRS